MRNGSDEDGGGSDGDSRPVKSSKSASKETAKHSLEEKKIMAAQFSVNIIDLFDPPKDVHFGRWNSRPLIPSEWKKLKTSFTIQSIKSFSPEHMMPLVISRQHVDPSCIQNNASGYDAKMLVLSDDGKKELTGLQMAGGLHRKAAVESIKRDKEKELSKLVKELEKVDKRKAANDDAVAKKRRELEVKVQNKKDEISKIGRWGVVLYDAGKQFTLTRF